MTISTYSKMAALVLASAVAAMVLVLPQTTRAAFDDLTLTTGVDISSGGVSFDVFGNSGLIPTNPVGGPALPPPLAGRAAAPTPPPAPAPPSPRPRGGGRWLKIKKGG